MSLAGIFSSIHALFYRVSGGRIGGSFAKVNVLLLTTTGVKSGKKRTRPVLFLRDGNQLVIIASNGGRPKHPGWWTNLKRNPVAEVQIKRSRETVQAEEAVGSERERLWNLVTSMYPRYAEYQKKTTRQIPVVILKPKSF